MAMTRIRRFNVLSVGKMAGIVYALIGLLAGAILALLSLVGAGLGAAFQDSGTPFLGALLGVGAIVILPIFYGIIGFLGGLLSSAVYNLAAGMSGGIEMELTGPTAGMPPVSAPGYGPAG